MTFNHTLTAFLILATTPVFAQQSIHHDDFDAHFRATCIVTDSLQTGAEPPPLVVGRYHDREEAGHVRTPEVVHDAD